MLRGAVLLGGSQCWSAFRSGLRAPGDDKLFSLVSGGSLGMASSGSVNKNNCLFPVGVYVDGWCQLELELCQPASMRIPGFIKIPA